METLPLTAFGTALVLIIVQLMKNSHTSWKSTTKGFVMLGLALLISLVEFAIRVVSDNNLSLKDADVLANQFILIVGTTQAIYIALKAGVSTVAKTVTSMFM
jgi:hypothetical protein